MNHRERQALAMLKKLPATLQAIDDDHPAFGQAATYRPVLAWRSREFVVQLVTEGEDRTRLTVQRARATDWFEPRNRDLRPISWDDLMEVKRQCGYGQSWAIEIYPPDAESIEAFPMRHLWLLSEAPAQAWQRSRLAAATPPAPTEDGSSTEGAP